MSSERRYSEQEVAFILEQASAAQENLPSALPSGEGLSLAQLQDIAREVGIAPEFVARAARAVERGDLVATQRRTWFGLPIGVSRTVEFDRPVTDAEWNRLVTTLRETFDARGHIRQEGAFRQWNNGNLQALLEPTERGHRLRLSTRKGNAVMLMRLGVGMLVGAAVLLVVQLLAAPHAVATPFWIPAMYAVMGAGALGSLAVQLPRWARTRAAQMEAIAEKAATAAPQLP